MTQTLRNAAPAFPQLTLPQMLRRRAQEMPDRVALRQKEFGIWQPVTWADYYRRSRHIALGLRSLGLEDATHVGILAENRLEWVLAQLGIGLANCITVGIYPTSPAGEVAYVAGHADIEVIVCEDQEQTDKILEVRDQLPRVRKIIVMETKGLRNYADSDIISFAELERLGAELERSQPALIDQLLERQQLSDIGLMVYTSGSTGKPKGAMISYRNILAQAPAPVERFGVGADTSYLSYLPLCHVAEQITTTFVHIYVGAQVNFGESLRTIVPDLQEVAPNVFLGVPRIWEKLHSSIHIKMAEAGPVRRWFFNRAIAACEPFGDKPAAQRTLREKLVFAFWYVLVLRALQNFIGLRRTEVAFSGAAPISPHIVRFFRTIGIPMVEVYGMTETSGMVTAPYVDDPAPGTVGLPVAGAEYRLGEAGELQLRGPMIFEGYYKNEAATADSLRDGWLHTGDVVQLVDGKIKIVDRLKDIMITAGGKNLSPSEIENTVKSSPFIKECIAIADARKFVSALIQIDMDTVGKWAEEKNIAYTTFRSLVENPAVRELIQVEVDKANGHLAQVSHVRKFHLLTKELDHDDDEVTATMKIRRSNIHKKYAAEIEAMYREAVAA